MHRFIVKSHYPYPYVASSLTDSGGSYDWLVTLVRLLSGVMNMMIIQASVHTSFILLVHEIS